jgi:hypothetical protein
LSKTLAKCLNAKGAHSFVRSIGQSYLNNFIYADRKTCANKCHDLKMCTNGKLLYQAAIKVSKREVSNLAGSALEKYFENHDLL